MNQQRIRNDLGHMVSMALVNPSAPSVVIVPGGRIPRLTKSRRTSRQLSYSHYGSYSSPRALRSVYALAPALVPPLTRLAIYARWRGGLTGSPIPLRVAP